MPERHCTRSTSRSEQARFVSSAHPYVLGSRNIRRRQLFAIPLLRTIGAVIAFELRPEMAVILMLLPETIQVQLCQRNLGAHQDDQLGAIVIFCGVTKKGTDQR